MLPSKGANIGSICLWVFGLDLKETGLIGVPLNKQVALLESLKSK